MKDIEMITYILVEVDIWSSSFDNDKDLLLSSLQGWLNANLAVWIHLAVSSQLGTGLETLS